MNEKDLHVAYMKFQKLASSKRKSFERKLDQLTHKALREYERKYDNEDYKLSKEFEDYLCRWLYIDENRVPSAPIYTEEDMGIIDAFVDEMSVHILDTVRRNLDTINAVFQKCGASEYASFPEFFCWYYHLAFAETMDYLVMKQKLSQPAHGYEYWIWKT